MHFLHVEGTSVTRRVRWSHTDAASARQARALLPSMVVDEGLVHHATATWRGEVSGEVPIPKWLGSLVQTGDALENDFDSACMPGGVSKG